MLVQELELNDQQHKAATWPDENLLILAGAGTGKTRTLIARAAYLLSQGVSANQLALLTFTRRAGKEMQERLVELIGPQADDVFAGTFHRFCMDWIKERPDLFGEGKTILDGDDQKQLMKRSRAEHDVDKEFPNPKELLSMHSYCRNTVQSLEEHATDRGYERSDVGKILKICRDYEARKRARNFVDFDDILLMFASRLQKDEEFRDWMKSKYRHILCDEVQDTNPVQWVILQELRDPAIITAVGDDAQSIYAFRGADFENVHSWSTRVPDGKVTKLTLNYRSTQPILDVSNDLLARSGVDYGKTLQAAREGGKPPEVVVHVNDFEEANWIAQDIQKQGVPYNDVMILVRTGFSARYLEAALVKEQIPHTVLGGQSMFQSAHVKDVLCAVRCMANVEDELAWMRYLTLWPGLGEKTANDIINEIIECYSPSEAFERLEQFPKAANAVALLTKIDDDFSEPGTALTHAIEGLASILEGKYDKWERRRKDLDLLQELVTEFDDLLDFVEAYTLDPVTRSEAGDNRGVVLATVHSAKGTEAHTVYMANSGQGQYPHSRSIGDKAACEEERRIMYVAITRARERLVINEHQQWQARPYEQDSDANCFLDGLKATVLK